MNINTIKKHLSNLPGWRTNRKLVVFESDDWGSTRILNRADYNSMKSKGLDLDRGDALRYNLYDNLATEEDLSSLFEVLKNVKDKNNNFAVFTPISLVANPDFQKIQESDYQKYYYIPFTENLKKTKGCENSINLWKYGIENHIFIPEFHGREHLNVQVWLRQLQKGDKKTLIAFDHNFWGFNNSHPYNITYQAAFNIEDPKEINYQKSILLEGLALFKNIFDYKASFFVPPNGAMNNGIIEAAHENGIKYISAAKIQREALGYGNTKKRYHYLGQRTNFGQLYLTRNCFFEPNQIGRDWVDSCLIEIDMAFKMKKPAVISTHRTNFIGAIDEKNRRDSLVQLNSLLKRMTEKWPDIEFMSSTELGDIINNKNKK